MQLFNSGLWNAEAAIDSTGVGLAVSNKTVYEDTR